MAFIPIERTSCLDSTINIDRLSGVMFTQENEAHQFVISCTQNNAQLTLTGTITAKVALANGNTIELVGTIDGGKAVVTLTQPCYNTAGRIQIGIFNTVGSTKLCIYAAIAYVQTAEHGDLIDGSQIIDSVEDLIADIQAAVATIPPDYSTLSNQVADLKSAIDNTNNYAVISPSWNETNGYIKFTDGGVATSSAWKRSDFDPIPDNATGFYLTVPVVTNSLQLEVVSAISFYTSNNASAFIANGSERVIFGTQQGSLVSYVTIPATAKYIRVSSLASFVNDYSIKAVLASSAVVGNYADLLKTTAKKVLVLCNDYKYGDNGPCWFEVMDSWNRDGIIRNDGSVVFPLPDQGPIVPSNAPYRNIMDVIKSYVGNNNLVYGNTNTLYNDTCTNEIDCSTFAMAVLQGITYENSRYVLGTESNNILGEHIGDSVINLSGRTVSNAMAEYFAMHKRLYRLPTSSASKAINLLQFGDLLFSHADGVNDDVYYGIGHVAVVLSTIPDSNAVVIAQAGGGGNISNEDTAVKTSCRIFDISDFNTYYPLFARPNYEENNIVNGLLHIIIQTATPGKYSLNNRTGLKMQLNAYLTDNLGRLAYDRYRMATTDYIEVPSNGSIIYNGELLGLDNNHTPYIATMFRYDANKKFISRNGILIENTPVMQQITKSGQESETKYIRIFFGHTANQSVVMSLADFDRFSAEITVS